MDTVEEITEAEVDLFTSQRYQLLNKIADQIESAPETYDQAHWGTQKNFDFETCYLDIPSDLVFTNPNVQITECDTTYCIAGFVASMSGWYPTIDYEYDRSRRNVTGISYDYSRVANKPHVNLDRCLSNKTKCDLPDGVVYDEGGIIIREVSRVAKEVLEMNDNDSNFLFASSNEWTPEQLRDIAEGSSPGKVAVQIIQ